MFFTSPSLSNLRPNGRRRIAPAGESGPNVLLRPSRLTLFTGRPRCCAAPPTKDACHGNDITTAL